MTGDTGDNPSSTAISYSQQCALIHSAITPPKVSSLFFIIDRVRERDSCSSLSSMRQGKLKQFLREMEIDHEIQKLKWFPSHTATYREQKTQRQVKKKKKVKQTEVERMVKKNDSIIHSIQTSKAAPELFTFNKGAVGGKMLISFIFPENI